MSTWVRVIIGLDVAIIVFSTSAILTGSLAALELMFILFLARPMMAFLFVLSSFDGDLRSPPPAA